MKRIIGRALAAIAVALGSQGAAAGQFSEKMYIIQLEAPSGGGGSVKAQFLTDKGTFGCSDAYYILHTATANNKEIYAMLLAAYLAHKQIDVWLGDTCDGGTYREVTHVRVYQ